ncbi:MAG: type domain protein, partial [Acidobacteria bacterium]|nr:type domain protein [Acidobacteriota bacterium]
GSEGGNADLLRMRTLVLAPAVAAALAAGAGRAQTLDGQIFLSWQRYDAGTLVTDGLRQHYDLRLSESFSDALQFRLLLRADDDSSGTTQVGTRSTRDFRQLQPGLEMTLGLPTLSVYALVDQLHTETGTSDSPQTFDRRLDRLLGSLTYSPEGLPSLAVNGYRRRSREDGTGRRIEDSIGTARLEYLWRGLRAAAYADVNQFTDSEAGFAREDRGLRGELGWGGALAGERLSLQVDALAYSGRLEERPIEGGTESRRPVVLAEGWDAHDETPADSTDRPLAVNPRLRDGDLGRAAGVPLGPEAQAFLALAASFNRFAQVDELQVVARDPAGNPVTSGGPVTWDVFTSLDGVLWSALPAPAQTGFDPQLGLWRITFDEVSVRWIKAVAFFVNTVPTEVTELLAFDRRALGPDGPLDTEIERTSVATSMSWRPGSRFTLSWNALFDESRELPEGEERIDQRDTTQYLTGLWEPRQGTSLLTQLGTNRSTRTEDGEDLDQGYDSALAVFTLAPNQNLVGSLEAARTENFTGEIARNTTDRFFAHGFGRLWGSLELTLDAGLTRQTSELVDGSIETPSVAALMRAQLTRTLRLHVSGSYQRPRATGALAALNALRDSDVRWYADLFWRPGDELGLGARFGSASDGEESTPIQGYRVEWRPFPGGALTVTALYDENVDPSYDRHSRRLLFSPSWRLNPSLTLRFDYLYLQSRGPGYDSEVESSFVALVWTL